MRVVNRKTFLSLPVGTIYCKGFEWTFESLCVKGETLEFNDWFLLDPSWIDEDSSTCFESLGEMLERGTSRPMQDTICRDGCYDDGAIFLVFEKADLHKLREMIDTAIALPVTVDGTSAG